MNSINPIELINTTTVQNAARAGFMNLYFRNGWLKFISTVSEKDIVLDRVLDGLTSPSISSQITATDTVLLAFGKLQKQINSIVIVGGTVTYTNVIPTPVTIGGINSGSTFNNKTMQEMWDSLLYPYIPQSCTISGGNSREFGSSTAISLVWSVTKHSNSITTINVNGTSIIPTGNTQAGTQNDNATQNVNTTFILSTSDGISTVTSSTSVSWLNKRYWGNHSSFSLPSNSQILALNQELSSTRIQTRNGINGAGNYLVFAFPTFFGTPTFVVNGLTSTAWTKIGNAISFTNNYGYINSYDIWISNTAQNSPLSTFQIN